MLENQFGVASFDGHLDGSLEPIDGVLVPMLPDDVAARPDLSGTFLSESLFHIGPGQMDDDHVFVHR